MVIWNQYCKTQNVLTINKIEVQTVHTQIAKQRRFKNARMKVIQCPISVLLTNDFNGNVIRVSISMVRPIRLLLGSLFICK